jgi:hypothetical protein
MLLIYIILWGAIAFAIYALAPRLYAMWIVLIGGWLLLPPAIYLEAGDLSIFPYWIIGSALPSDILVTKAWLAPAITIVGSMIFDRARWFQFRYHWTDFAILAFCLWPTAQSAFVKASDPSGLLSSLYLAGVWGLPWLLGRLYFRDRNDARAFTGVLTLATLTMLPLMIIEGVSTVRIHTFLFGANPFVFDGVGRYIGFRPQLLFENGNQYGIWCAGATVAAFWRSREAVTDGRSFWNAVFFILLAITVLAQSVGAILLMFVGIALLALPNAFKILPSLGAAGLAIGIILGSLHISGAVPLRSIAEKTVIGKAVADGIRATGRGSFVWRVGQDTKALPLIQEKPVIGYARWNWFMPVNSRPWGLPLLVLGQFGLIGIVLLAAALFGALNRHLAMAARGSATSRLFAVIILLFGADALLNSFVFYPAVLVAAALVRPTLTNRVTGTLDQQQMV